MFKISCSVMVTLAMMLSRVNAEPVTTSPEAAKSVSFSAARGFTCERVASQIVFNSNGTGTFSVTSYTTEDSVDDWAVLHEEVIVLTAGGATLFKLGPYSSPVMKGGSHERYNWSAPIAFDSTKYAAIGMADDKLTCDKRPRP